MEITVTKRKVTGIVLINRVVQTIITTDIEINTEIIEEIIEAEERIIRTTVQL